MVQNIARRNQFLLLGLAVYLVSSLISMAVMSLGTAFLVLMIAWGFGGGRPAWEALRTEASRPESRILLRLSLLLAGACIASLLAGILWPLGYGGMFVRISFFSDAAKLWYLFWPLALAAALRALPQAGRARALRIWLYAFAALSAVAYLQYFTGWPREQMIPSSEPPRYHATLFIGHHLSVASIWIFPLFFALELLRDRKRALAAGFRSPAALGGIVALGLGALFLTHARTLWVALPVGLVVWALWRLPRKWSAALLGAILLGGLALSQAPAIQSRFNTSSFAFSLSTRLDLWRMNWEFFRERPVLGVGWRHNHELSGYYQLARHEAQGKKDGYVFSGHAHNNFLDFLAGTGVVGTLAWLLWCAGALWLAWRAGNAGIFCAWIVFHLNGLTQMNFWEGKVAHQAMIAVAFSLLGALLLNPSSPKKEST